MRLPPAQPTSIACFPSRFAPCGACLNLAISSALLGCTKSSSVTPGRVDGTEHCRTCWQLACSVTPATSDKRSNIYRVFFMAPQVFVNTAPESTIFLIRTALYKKQIPPQMNTDDTDLKFKRVLLNFFDPCKSVLSVSSVVRFAFWASRSGLGFQRLLQLCRFCNRRLAGKAAADHGHGMAFLNRRQIWNCLCQRRRKHLRHRFAFLQMKD